MENHFDYIIIGAGSAGCVVANRLSADPKISVCLIEAGGDGNTPWIKIPAGVFGIYGNKKYDYTFKGSPQKHLKNRVMTINRGKALGGSSAINSMVYIRGNRGDYNHWAAQGCEGWDYESVLPVFKKLENNQLNQAPEYHGFSGELPVSKPQDVNTVAHTFVSAGEAAGLPENTDFNGPSQLGLGIYDVTQLKGQRASSYHAFLEPIQASRDNLTILTHTEVFSLIHDEVGKQGELSKECRQESTARCDFLELETTKVSGVVIEKDGIQQSLYCNKEVIVCAGAIASPRLLLASGIGDEKQLSALGIECKKHLPGVGENLQDHIDSMVTVRSSSTQSIGVSLRTFLPHVLPAPLKYWLKRKGWWTTNYVEAGGFAKTKYAEDECDIQFHFTPLYRSHRGKKFEFGHGYSVFTCVLRPKSAGSVKLANDGSRRNVVIDHNFFSDDADKKVLVEGLKKAREILASPAFDAIRGEEMAPGKGIQTDAEILQYLENTTGTVYHPVGTCKMGRDELSVVDPLSLKVYGFDNLRVMDASIMPSLISGNTNAPSMMIGERGAQMILGDVN